MIDPYIVGNIISIDGLKVTAIMRDNTNMLSYFYHGATYRGVTIGEYVGIIRGPYKIVGKVEREYLEDTKHEPNNQTYELSRFLRKIELSIVGSFFNNKFEFGIRCFPMIYNEIVLLIDDEITQIIQGRNGNKKYKIPFGKSVQERINVELPWDSLLNTHIGIFGNTGSGKSNTLAKIYTELFRLNKKSIFLDGKSQFLFLDFNGEYSGLKTLSEDKKVIELSTKSRSGKDKITLTPENFWDVETLSILFSATEKTQRPFILNALEYFVDKETHDISSEEMPEKICSGFYNVFKGNNNKESLKLLNNVYDIVGLNINVNDYYQSNDGSLYNIPWSNYLWNATNSTYYYGIDYINRKTESEIMEKRDQLFEIMQLDQIIINIENLSLSDKLKIVVNLQLIYGLRCNYVQFDHINPLLSRIESRSKFLDKIIDLGDTREDKTITVISLKDCNQDAKKMIPLLIAKQEYNVKRHTLIGTNCTLFSDSLCRKQHTLVSTTQYQR